MVQIHSAATAKTLGECTPGELIFFQFNRGQSWAIVLEQDEARHTLVGLLTFRDDETPGPIYDTWLKRFPCLSFGTDWAVKPLSDSDSYAGNRPMMIEAGVLICDRDRWLVCFSTASNKPHYELYFDLTNSSIGSEPSQVAAPFRSWEAWESIDQVGRSGKPLFDMGKQDV